VNLHRRGPRQRDHLVVARPVTNHGKRKKVPPR
jgi:hypothetical protein